MTHLAIEVHNLRKSFRKRNGFFKAEKFWALDGVSFTVAAGSGVATGSVASPEGVAASSAPLPGLAGAGSAS